VPVVDLGLLLGGPSCPDRLSTRIILVDARPPGAEGKGDGGTEPQPEAGPEGGGAASGRRRASRRRWLLGLLAGQVSGVAAGQPAQMISARMQLPQSPYRGPIVEIDQEMVQLVAAEHVLDPPLRDAFFAAGAAAPAAGG